MQTFGRKMLDKMVDNKNLLKTTEKINQKKRLTLKNPKKKRKIPSVDFGRHFDTVQSFLSDFSVYSSKLVNLFEYFFERDNFLSFRNIFKSYPDVFKAEMYIIFTILS